MILRLLYIFIHLRLLSDVSVNVLYITRRFRYFDTNFLKFNCRLIIKFKNTISQIFILILIVIF